MRLYAILLLAALAGCAAFTQTPDEKIQARKAFNECLSITIAAGDLDNARLTCGRLLK